MYGSSYCELHQMVSIILHSGKSPDALILTFSATCRYRFVCDMELY